MTAAPVLSAGEELKWNRKNAIRSSAARGYDELNGLNASDAVVLTPLRASRRWPPGGFKASLPASYDGRFVYAHHRVAWGTRNRDADRTPAEHEPGHQWLELALRLDAIQP